MRTLRLLALGAVSISLMACSTEQEEVEMIPEDLPSNQGEMAPMEEAEDSVIAGEEPAEAAEPAERPRKAEGDGSVTSSTSKKSKNATPVSAPKEEIATPDDGGVSTSTKKKKR